MHNIQHEMEMVECRQENIYICIEYNAIYVYCMTEFVWWNIITFILILFLSLLLTLFILSLYFISTDEERGVTDFLHIFFSEQTKKGSGNCICYHSLYE